MILEGISPESIQAKHLLSNPDSAAVVACLDRWMRANNDTSVYETALLVGISRATLGRWIKDGVRIPVRSALRLLEGLTGYEKPDPEAKRAVLDLASLLHRPPSADHRLFDEFRRHRVRARRAMLAISAAGFRLVPIDGGDNGQPV